MPGLVPGIHVFVSTSKAWMAGASPAMTMWVGRTQRPRALFDHDVGFVRMRAGVAVGPGKLDGAALGGDGEEGDERVGGDRRVEIGAEHLLAVIAAHERVDDVARYGGAG